MNPQTAQEPEVIHITTFLEHHLGDILQGRDTLQCFFTTYRGVRDYAPGDFPLENKPGLSIRIGEGGTVSNIALAAVAFFDNAGPVREETRGHLQKAVEQSAVPETEQPLFVVIYAGVTVFEEALEQARQIRRQAPASTILVHTCDCDLYVKARTLHSYLQDGTINYATQSTRCGGRDDLRNILDSIVMRWPSAEAS